MVIGVSQYPEYVAELQAVTNRRVAVARAHRMEERSVSERRPQSIHASRPSWITGDKRLLKDDPS